MKKSVKSSPQVRERSVRMVAECRGEYPSQWAAVESVAAKVGCTPQTLHTWVRQHKRDSYVSTWQGCLYSAFLTEVFARRIVG